MSGLRLLCLLLVNPDLWLVDFGGLDGNGPDLCLFTVNDGVVEEYLSSRGWVYPINPVNPLRLSWVLQWQFGPISLQKINKSKYQMLVGVWKKS